MRRPFIRAFIAAAVLAPAAFVGAGGASAQLPPLPIDTTTTTQPGSSTSAPPPPSSTTTITAARKAVTTTTAPEGPPSTAPPAQPSGPLELPPVPSGDGGSPPGQSGPAAGIPPWALEQINSVPRTGGNSTERLLEALQPLMAFGFTPEEAAQIGFGKFPVAGEATFADDWWYPRYVPEFHLHQGTDVFAAFGTPVMAPFDGILTIGEGRVGGIYSYLTMEADGTYYYFAHLDHLPEIPEELRLTDPAEVARYAFRESDQPVAYRVQAGDVIGNVGDSGNAKGGDPHVHFEVHPAGGEAVNPKPVLDQWLAEAEAAVKDVIALYTSRGPKAVISTQRTRASGPGQFAAPTRPLAAEILGVSSAGPGTGVQVVTEEVVRAVSRIDWEAHRAALARPMEEVHAALAALFGAG